MLRLEHICNQFYKKAFSNFRGKSTLEDHISLRFDGYREKPKGPLEARSSCRNRIVKGGKQRRKRILKHLLRFGFVAAILQDTW